MALVGAERRAFGAVHYVIGTSDRSLLTIRLLLAIRWLSPIRSLLTIRSCLPIGASTGDRTTTVAGPHTLHTMWAVFMQITTSLAVIVSVTVYSRRTPACVCYLITQRQTGVEVRALLPDMARLCAADQLI